MTTRTAYSTTSRRPGLLSRLRARNTPGTTRTTRSSRRGMGGTTTTTTTTKTTKTTHHPVGAAGTTGVTHHHRRHATIGDKISGALLRLRGSLSRRPGKKAAGTRRMHGTDGRVSRRHRRTCRSSHTLPGPPAPDLTRKPSAVVADEALNTAVHLVTRIQTLQAHTEVVEAALEAKEAELEQAIDDRDKWKERAESIISLGAQPSHEQSTDVEGLKRRVTDLEMQRDELAVTSQQAEEQVQALKEDLAANAAEAKAEAKESSPPPTESEAEANESSTPPAKGEAETKGSSTPPAKGEAETKGSSTPPAEGEAEAKESSPPPEEEKSDSEPGERKDPDDEPQPAPTSSAEKEKDPDDDNTIQKNPPPHEGEKPSSPKNHPDPIPDEEEDEEESLSTIQLGS